MSFELWFAFLAASAALLAVPGPVVIFLFTQTVTRSRWVAFAAVPGVVLGDLAAMTISLAGAGAVLSASAMLFTALKIAGAGYLVWLGFGLWRSGLSALEPTAATLAAPESRAAHWLAFRQAFVVTALNPKDIVFFVSFLPQFVDPTRPALPQLTVIVATFLAMVFLSTSLWIIFGHRIQRVLNRPSARRWVQRVGAASSSEQVG